MMIDFFEKLKKVKAIILSLDGVLTNANVSVFKGMDIQYNESIHELRSLNFKDLYILQHALKLRFKVAIISENDAVELAEYLKENGFKDVFLKVNVKHFVFESYLIDHAFDVSEILYIGCDIPDLIPMKNAGIAACPQDAVPEIKKVSDYIAESKGGEGCVREIVELVMKAQDHWEF